MYKLLFLAIAAALLASVSAELDDDVIGDCEDVLHRIGEEVPEDPDVTCDEAVDVCNYHFDALFIGDDVDLDLVFSCGRFLQDYFDLARGCDYFHYLEDCLEVLDEEHYYYGHCRLLEAYHEWYTYNYPDGDCSDY